MKKRYIEPEINIFRIEETSPIATSNGVTSEKGIGWGGLDNVGKPADANKRRFNSEF